MESTSRTANKRATTTKSTRDSYQEVTALTRRPSHDLDPEQPDLEERKGDERFSRRHIMDGGWGWLVVLGAAIVNMMFGINYRVFGLVYLELRERFQASATASVWVGGVNLLLGGFCGPVGALLLQRYSHRCVSAVGTVLAVLGMISTGYVPNLPLAYITYGLFTGVGIALTHLTAVAIVGEYFEKKKALALALQSVTSGLSAVVFSPVMAILFTEFSYSGTFLIFGGVFTNMFIACALFRPIQYNERREKLTVTIEVQQSPQVCDTSTSETQISGKEEMEKSIQAEKPSKTRRQSSSSTSAGGMKQSRCGCHSLRVALNSPVFLSFFFLILSATAGRAVTGSFLPALSLEFGSTFKEASLLPAISGMSAALGSLLVGAAFDTKYIRKYRVYLYSMNTFLLGATMLWMPFTRSFAGLAVPTAVHGVSSTVIFAQQMTVLTDLLGRQHAVAGFGVIRIAIALGSILGRSISALFVDMMATNKFGFYIMSSLTMVASMFFMAVVFLHSRKDTPKRKS